MVKSVEIEVDGTHNEAMFFAPLQKSIRGRFDLMRMGEPMARIAAADWPQPIPSLKLGINAEGNGYITEPLHDAEYTATREKILKKGMTLEPKITEIPGIDLPTWCYWIKRAVEDGLAKVVAGQLPDKIDGKPRTNFIVNDPPENPMDRLVQRLGPIRCGPRCSGSIPLFILPGQSTILIG
jgi:hypothetical protein